MDTCAFETVKISGQPKTLSELTIQCDADWVGVEKSKIDDSNIQVGLRIIPTQALFDELFSVKREVVTNVLLATNPDLPPLQLSLSVIRSALIRANPISVILTEDNPSAFVELTSIFEEEAKFKVKSVEVDQTSGWSVQVHDGEKNQLRIVCPSNLTTGGVSVARCIVEGAWGEEVVCIPCVRR